MSGTQKGREVPPQKFTFSTGVTVGLKRVSPLLRDDIDAQLRVEHPVPEPPMKKRNYGTEDEPEWIEEVDLSDSKFKEDLRKWGIEHANRLGDKLLWVAVRRGVEIELGEEELRQVQEVRDDLLAVGTQLDPDDKFVYITRVALGSTDELRELHDLIFAQSRPSQQEVDAIKATFPSDVQQEEHLSTSNPEGEGRVERRVLVDGSLQVLRDPMA